MAEQTAFSLLTSTSYSPARPAGDRFSLLHRHLARLGTAHAALARRLPASWCAATPMPSDDALHAELDRAVSEALTAAPERGDLRVRLSVLPSGQAKAEAFPLPPKPLYPVRLVLDDRPTEYTSPFLRHKTSLRAVYDSCRARHGATLTPSPSRADPPFDVLMFNPARQVTETSISNVAFRLGGGGGGGPDRAPWVTPAATCGLLEGVMRAEMLERGEIVEGIVTVDEVCAAAERGSLEILCFNGVRGSFKACLVLEGERAG
ncbi:hypothetical protein JCM3770_002275 [Rhodotorula araucariae]